MLTCLPDSVIPDAFSVPCLLGKRHCMLIATYYKTVPDQVLACALIQTNSRPCPQCQFVEGIEAMFNNIMLVKRTGQEPVRKES